MVGIVIDGELAYAKGAGVIAEGSQTAPGADTVYRIGSVTKSFTGLALFAAGPSLALRKTARDGLFARTGDCKLSAVFHYGFEWGVTLACKDQEIDILVPTAPDDATKVARLEPQPRAAANDCK